ncbi:hypothetical protein OG394_23825 [Kribbella sp. NBC_01245]|uniref:hypothetical protein n=1 Tax=Kribbella sp. NBC_01245 TaxID=2903578 RepID=UPI002E28CCB8|nr:hypothetical protein [Kribbella sp. NBC_01245]
MAHFSLPLAIALTLLPAPATTTAAAVDPPGTVTVGTAKYGIALMPGAVFTTDAAHELEPPRPSQLIRQSLSGTGDTIVVGPPQLIGSTHTNLVVASAYRVMVSSELRYGTGAPKFAGGFPEALSGTRLVVHKFPSMIYPYNFRYDVRTSTQEPDVQPPPPWRFGAVDAFGNYLVYSRQLASTTQVRRRDQATGVDLLVATIGRSGVRSVAVNGNLVAWVTDCPDRDRPCSQTVGYRIVGGTGALGPVRTFATRGTKDLDLSATHLALDTITAKREIRLVTLGSNAIRVIGALPPNPSEGSTGGIPVEYPPQIPVHFDLDGDRIGWLGAVQNAHVTAVATPPIRARYLGNGIIPGSFNPNVSRFGASLPFSKSLTQCAVVFRQGTRVFRTLACIVRNGDALISWDGRDSAGRIVPKGRYDWTLTGSDSAGSALWYTGTGARIGSSVTVV